MLTRSGVLGGVRAWTPAQLFRPGDLGVFIDPSNTATVFSSGTTPAVANDALGQISDLSGNANNFTSANKPTLKTDGTRWWIDRVSSGNVMSVASSTAKFKFLHDGTGCEIIAAARFGSTSAPNAYMPLVGNNNGTTVKVGATLFGDDRAAVPRTATSGFQVTMGSGGVQNSGVAPDSSTPCNTDLIINGYFSTVNWLSLQVQQQVFVGAANARTPSSADSFANLTMFSDGSNGATANMRLYGLFIINRILTFAERLLVTAWMNQKAGLTSNNYSVNKNATIEVVTNSPFHGYPGVCRLNTGSQLQLLSAYRVSADEINTDGVLKYKISLDGGATNGPELTLYDPGAGLDARGVSLLLLQNGTILANFAVANTSVYNTWNSYVMIGTVSGSTVSWGSPISINGGAGGSTYVSYGQGVQLSNGTIVIPMQCTLTGKSFNSAGVIKSLNAAGTSWSGWIAITPASVANSDAYNETSLVVFADDSLAAYIRHDVGATKGYARSQSADIDNWTGLADVISIGALWGQPTAVNRGSAVWLMARNASAQSTYWQSSDAAGITFGAGTVYANNNMHSGALLLPNAQIGAVIGVGSSTAVGIQYQQFA